MKLIDSGLPLLSREWRFLEQNELPMLETKRDTEPPRCYGKEPYAGDGREYPDYTPEQTRTINITRGIIKTMAEAEEYVRNKWPKARILAKQPTRGGDMFSFKVVG